MPPDDVVGQAQLPAQPPHLVLEQVPQRLDQLEPQVLGQSAHVVVELDRGGRSVAGAAAFDHVGIKRSLGQEMGPLDPGRLVGKTLDEGMADPPSAFPADWSLPANAARKLSSRLDHVQVGLEMVAELADHRLRLAGRNRPLSTRMHDNCGPMASANSAATTAESTPPESPQITRSLAHQAADLVDRLPAKSPNFQVPRAPQTWTKSCRGSCRPAACASPRDEIATRRAATAGA